MNYYGNPMTRLIEELAALPGIGGKSAQRLAFHIINLPREKVAALSEAILAAKDEVKYCSVCCNLTEEEICPVCANPKRDHSVIMVVEDPRDMAAYERTKEFHGVYHVLHGAISPMTGIGPQDIHIRELLSRIDGGGGGHSCDQPECGGRGNGDVSCKAAEALGCEGDKNRKRCSGWRRFGICGRDYAFQSLGGQERTIKKHKKEAKEIRS